MASTRVSTYDHDMDEVRERRMFSDFTELVAKAEARGARGRVDLAIAMILSDLNTLNSNRVLRLTTAAQGGKLPVPNAYKPRPGADGPR